MAKAEVVKRLEKAWEMLSNRIDEENEKFLEDANDDELAGNYFVCWEESDVPFQLGRFFYLVNDDWKYVFHVETKLKPSNFKSYRIGYNGNLESARRALGKITKVDFLIEDRSTDIFVAIGEAKYFRYKVEGISRGTRTVLGEVGDGYNRLTTFEKEEICKYTVFVVLDKYYHRYEPTTWNRVLAKLDKMKESGVIVFWKEV